MGGGIEKAGCPRERGGIRGRVRRFVERPCAHVLLLVCGCALLLVSAGNGFVWFDETYSVALSSHPLSEIWRIGSHDVHPVLYYAALHGLFLLFGRNLLVYRLFSVAGIAATAALGLTHARRLWGSRTGIAFSGLILFLPYLAYQGTQIRMYAWALFAVTLCYMEACRIVRALHAPASAVPRGLAGSRVGAATWLAFGCSSLAAAYLHYYGTMSAFFLNLFVLAALVRTHRARCGAGCREAFADGEVGPAEGVRCAEAVAVSAEGPGRVAGRIRLDAPLAIFLAGAAVQVAAFLPWLSVLLAQAGSVSHGF